MQQKNIERKIYFIKLRVNIILFLKGICLLNMNEEEKAIKVF